MNWRRLRLGMGSSPEPSVPAYRRLRMHRKRPQVLGADLNRSESEGCALAAAARMPQHVRTSPLGGRMPARASHSALMLAARITLAHFSVSSAMSLLKSEGEPTNAVPPSSTSRDLILGSTRPALTSLLSRPMISVGVFLGAPIATNALASKPGRNSPNVGTSGS